MEFWPLGLSSLTLTFQSLTSLGCASPVSPLYTLYSGAFLSFRAFYISSVVPFIGYKLFFPYELLRHVLVPNRLSFMSTLLLLIWINYYPIIFCSISVFECSPRLISLLSQLLYQAHWEEMPCRHQVLCSEDVGQVSALGSGAWVFYGPTEFFFSLWLWVWTLAQVPLMFPAKFCQLLRKEH